jgi:hypothetical protein
MYCGVLSTPNPGNLLTIGATAITGAANEAAIISEGFTFHLGQTNTYLRIPGLPDFTSATFSDSVSGSFEFALGVFADSASSRTPFFRRFWFFLFLGEHTEQSTPTRK